MYLRIEYIVKCASYQHRYDSVVGKAIGRDERKRDKSGGNRESVGSNPTRDQFSYASCKSWQSPVRVRGRVGAIIRFSYLRRYK